MVVACLVLTGAVSRAGDVLCIGLNEPDDYAALDCAEKDAREMAESLAARGMDVKLLTGEAVTSKNVSLALEDGPRVVYFAGHGKRDGLVLADAAMPLGQVAQGRALVLLDCCYAGATLASEGSTRVLAAARHEAFEDGGHGLFSKYLLEWLKDGRDLADERMVPYVRNGITRETGGWQRPVLGYL